MYSKLKAFNDVTAKESPLWMTFVRFRNQNADSWETPEGWEGTEDELHLATIHHIIRLRRYWEPWQGQLMHELIGEIHWGISNGIGEDLLDYIEQAKSQADEALEIGLRMQLLQLERIVITTYSATSQERVKRLQHICNERIGLLTILRNGERSAMSNKLSRDRKRKPHRVKSDLLFRLSKTLTDPEFTLLKSYIQLHSKNAKQIRLIEYYRGLDIWTKEAEQADWRGEKLAQLKNRTLVWLMRRMGMLGGWQGALLHDLIGDIRWCLLNGINAEMIGFFDMAERKAVDEEAYESLIILMELKEKGQKRFAICASSALDFRLRDLIIRLEEIEAVHEFRITYFEQIKLENSTTGINTTTKWLRLLNALSEIKPDGLVAGEALREYYLLHMLAATTLMLHPTAMEMGQLLLKLFGKREYLASSNWKRYFKELWSICNAFSSGGEIQLSSMVIEKMEHLSNTSPNLLMQSATLRLLAYSDLFHATRDIQIAEKAIQHFQRSRAILLYESELKSKIWLYFFISKVFIETGHYQEAIGALNQIIDQKAKATKIILAHSRLMILLCYLAIKTDVEVVFDAAAACSMFIHRQDDLPSYLNSLAKSIKKIASFEYSSNEQVSAFEKAIQQAKANALELGGNQTIAPPYELILERLMHLSKGYQ